MSDDRRPPAPLGAAARGQAPLTPLTLYAPETPPIPETATPSSRPLPAASLIICSRNRPAFLDWVVGSVLAGDYLPLRWRYGRGQGAYYAKHLHRGDLWMLRRLRWDAGTRARQFLEQLPEDPRRALGQLFFLGGTVAGMAQWLATDRSPPATAEKPSVPKRQALSAAPVSEVVPEPVGGPLPPASLIICSRDRGRLLEESVWSVLAGGEVPAELIIVDQSIAPNAVLKALRVERGCVVRYFHSETRGECPARNAGIAAARHDRLVFTDDDVRVAPDWYGLMVRTLAAAGPRSAVTCRILPDSDGKTGGFVPTVRERETPAVYAGRTLGQPLYTVGMAIYRSAFEEVGLFDEWLGAGGRFPGGEDGDLGYRLLAVGYRIVYQPRAVVYQRAWRLDAEYFDVRWSYGVGHGAFCAKHLSLRDPYMLERLRYELGQKALHLPGRLASDPRRAVGDAAQVLGTLYGIAKWLVIERLAPREPATSPLPARPVRPASSARAADESRRPAA